jgi:hypothetical protein
LISGLAEVTHLNPGILNPDFWRKQGIASVAVVVLMVATLRAETLLTRVTRPYDAIQSLSCEIRRDMPLASGGSARMLSRVYFQRGDRMHVETSVPLKRRIVSDGTNFWSHIDGMAKGYGAPVAQLNDDMLGNLRSVPGSAEMALRQLADAREVPLPPTADFRARTGYDNGKTFTVLSLDGQGRLVRLEVFGSAAMSESIARTDYSAFQEVLPGVWIACVQKTQATLRGASHAETLRVANLAVNGALPAMLFNAEAFFTGVAFVDSLEKMDGGEE